MTETSLAELLSQRTREGDLYEKLPGGKIRCFACGHRCPIPEGHSGVCKIRFNENGRLKVPFGYVAALQDDPIEKKPFFHALPGARALSFGMLGCDYHCGYCFTPDVRIATSKGIFPISDIVEQNLDAEIFTMQGKKEKILRRLKRNYRGKVLKIKPAFLPMITVTPEHPLYARLRPDRFPSGNAGFVESEKLTKNHCLAVPKNYEFSEKLIIKTADILQPWALSYRAKRKISAAEIKAIIAVTKQGKSSREVGLKFGKSPSHIRHLISKVNRGIWKLEELGVIQAGVLEESGGVRFSKEHRPGIPSRIPVNRELAELFGYYCAEGSVSRSKNRVHSATLNFSFAHKEKDKAERVRVLIWKCFGVRTYLVRRATTLAVCSNKTSLALFFKGLCGERGSQKKVPSVLFNSHREIVESFIAAYVAGDGHQTADGHVRVSSISEELAWGVAWLVQKLGYLPQFYKYPVKEKRILLGRIVNQSPWIYLVRWYPFKKTQRHVWEDEKYQYILIEKIDEMKYEGSVYNLEIENDPTYLANFSIAHNCQNWVTSQALRDPIAGAPPVEITPEKIVQIARERGCEVVTSTYNEPLITSEWAVEIFKQCKKAGLVTSYVSNGNATPEVLDYIKPWVDLYKVDLKSFDDKHYRELGGTLENVCRSIRAIYERGFWIEVLTLLIPGFNDSQEELTKLTEFIASVSIEIPWHVTAFHKDYKMTDPENTSAFDLLKAVKIGEKSGLRYIYPGNLPGQVGKGENTYCSECGELLIERIGFEVTKDKISEENGKCFKCGFKVPGFWKGSSQKRVSEHAVKPIV